MTNYLQKNLPLEASSKTEPAKAERTPKNP
jgi:hypothetical protein